MSPGFDRPKHPGFTRTVNHKCMFCHNAYPSVSPERARQGWDHDVQFPTRLPEGIDCQRCHGPGGPHVRAAVAAESLGRVRAAIVNPARLSSERQMDVCMQCHLETTTFRLPESYRRFGRGFYSYRPGEALGDYIVHFDHAPGTGHDDKFEIVSAAYRLRQSRLFYQERRKTNLHDLPQSSQSSLSLNQRNPLSSPMSPLPFFQGRGAAQPCCHRFQSIRLCQLPHAEASHGRRGPRCHDGSPHSAESSNSQPTCTIARKDGRGADLPRRS